MTESALVEAQKVVTLLSKRLCKPAVPPYIVAVSMDPMDHSYALIHGRPPVISKAYFMGTLIIRHHKVYWINFWTRVGFACKFNFLCVYYGLF